MKFKCADAGLRIIISRLTQADFLTSFTEHFSLLR